MQLEITLKDHNQVWCSRRRQLRLMWAQWGLKGKKEDQLRLQIGLQLRWGHQQGQAQYKKLYWIGPCQLLKAIKVRIDLLEMLCKHLSMIHLLNLKHGIMCSMHKAIRMESEHWKDLKQVILILLEINKFLHKLASDRVYKQEGYMTEKWDYRWDRVHWWIIIHKMKYL